MSAKGLQVVATRRLAAFAGASEYVAHTCLPSPLISDSEATSIAARALRIHALTEFQHHLRLHHLSSGGFR